MARCIYCRSELNDNSPPDELTRSREHIVPFAIGGSNAFSTFDVSKKYNNDYGRDIDAKFIDLLPISIKRQMLNLVGQSGKVPPIVWRGKSMDNGAPSTITIHADWKVECEFDISTDRIDKKTHEILSVSGDADKVKEILFGMLEKYKKHGKRIYSVSGEEITTMDDFSRHYDIEESNNFGSSIVAFDLDVWTRGIFKMILGLGHVLLGPDWTFSSDGGDRFRTVLEMDRQRWPINSMKGFTTGELPSEIANVLGIDQEVREQNRHTLAILPYEGQTVAVVSLFGGKDIPEALVGLGGERGKLAVVNETMNPKARIGVQIDPTTRGVEWITVEALVKAVQ
ncbi:MAG: hypothetical protein OXC10_19615 [Rhodospirillaceae bacterium]|nr:hypothetical protein [Rhodospirillaceae bacterium]